MKVAVAFTTRPSKVAVRSLQWIGLVGKVNGRRTDCGFQLRSRFYAFEAILPTGIFVLDRLERMAWAASSSLYGGETEF
jgi:hypothetical protein